MTIEKTMQGAWRITDIIGGYLFVRQYFGYSKSEAVRAFINENGKGGRMTARDLFLALAFVACLVIALALCGGACGPSDLELFQRAAEPSNL